MSVYAQQDGRLLSPEQEAAVRAWVQTQGMGLSNETHQLCESIWQTHGHSPFEALCHHLDALTEQIARYQNALVVLNQSGNAGTLDGCGWCATGLAAAKRALEWGL